MLIPLREWIEINGRNRCFRIKRSSFRLTQGLSKPEEKATKYFGYLHDQRVLEGFEPTGRYLTQELAGGKNCFVEVAENSIAPFFVSMTSSRNSLNRALREASGKNIETVSGLCLFGGRADRAVTSCGRIMSLVSLGKSEDLLPSWGETGEQVVDVRGGSFSLYEAEKILRLSTILSKLKQPMGMPLNVAGLMTPRIQYFLYLMPMYQRNLISSKAYLKWMDVVSARELALRKALGKRLDIDILPSSLRMIEDEVRYRVSRSRSVSLRRIVQQLAERNPIWEEVIREESPTTWKNLINASYAVSLIDQARIARRRGCALIHVDDPLERVILNETARRCRGLKRSGVPTSPIIGIYVLQNVVSGVEERDSDLYYTVGKRRDLRLIVREYRGDSRSSSNGAGCGEGEGPLVAGRIGR